jgi:hypothetical protein
MVLKIPTNKHIEPNKVKCHYVMWELGLQRFIFKCNWCSPPLMAITSGSNITKSVTNRCPMVHLGKNLKRYLNRTLKFLPCKNLTKSLIYFVFVKYLPCCLLIYYKCFIFLSFINWTKVPQSFNCWTLFEQTMLNVVSLPPNVDLAII